MSTFIQVCETPADVDGIQGIWRTPIARGTHSYLASELVVDEDGTSNWWVVVQVNHLGHHVTLRTQSLGEAKRVFKAVLVG